MPNQWVGADDVGLPGVSIREIHMGRKQPEGAMSRTVLSPFERMILGQHPVTIDKICSCWTPDVLLKMRRLSSSLFYAIEAYFCRQWNVKFHLRRWFYDVPQFLRQLGTCNGLVSGSEALTFFDRRRFLGSDLDIYLPAHGLLPMGRYLKSQSYCFQPSHRDHIWFDAAAMLHVTAPHAIRELQSTNATTGPDANEHTRAGHDANYGSRTFDFIRPIPAHLPTSYGSHIQLIVVHCDPMEHIVNTFHSTGLMNVLTSTHAISLFPNTTFVHRETYCCKDLSAYPAWDAPWVGKYRRRGFKVFIASDRVPYRPELAKWKREVGDASTWILPYKRTALHSEAPILAPYNHYVFEVLDRSFGVAPPGAVSRVGPRLLYRQVSRSMAWLVDATNPVLYSTFNSFEVSAAFSEYHTTTVAESDAFPSDSGDDLEDEGDTEEAEYSE